ncbi:hypothetical protein [Nocardioides panaciterrulae]|uniref:Peptidase metallopeptidase domain-containing protein n=1 Tax=Nocardioides panaciterrulae TaxID=661492 RepID=A0A7Y9E7Y4_9ACTN|nr:hypothetical protein [Nocardioides panaciterrulae]NYD42768.1 hypothetical protein [Nocardioides panaciterrulae]
MRRTSASLKLATLVAAGLVAVGVAGPVGAVTPGPATSTTGTAAAVPLAPRAGASEGETRMVSFGFPSTHEWETAQVVGVRAEVDTTQPTVLRLQRAVGGDWTDVAVVAVPTGGYQHDFVLPTEQAGSVTLRFVVDADPVFPAYVSAEYAYTVTDPTPVVSEPATITLTEPGVAAATFGKALTVTGRVGGPDPAGRAVRLELDTENGWTGLTSVRTDATGGYTVEVPTDWYYSGTLRAQVLATETDEAAVSPATFPMRVRPGYRPGGRAHQWNALVRGYRWNPCDAISYRVNLTGAPKHARAQVERAFAAVHAATGLTFVYDGATTAIPYRTDHRGSQRSGAELTLAFATARQVRGLAGNTIGRGGWLSGSGGEIQEGAVVLDRRAHLRSGFGEGATWGGLLLHEIGHAMNLDHTRARNEVMHAGLGSHSPGHYQAGDLTGLARMGAMSGCIGAGDATVNRAGAPRWHVTS